MKIGGLTLFERVMKKSFNGIYIELFHWRPANSLMWRCVAHFNVCWYWRRPIFRLYYWTGDQQVQRAIGVGPFELSYGVHDIIPVS